MGTGFALRTGGSLRTMGTGFALRTGGSLRTLGTGFALRSGRSLRALGAGFALWTGGSLRALGTLAATAMAAGTAAGIFLRLFLASWVKIFQKTNTS